uniref:Alpha-mannosidase n=1 Tax=Chenopodium quinoa TaxID=63459 RepID=A0A803KWE4_CHEQI
MGKPAMSISVVLFVLAVFGSFELICCIKYKTGAGVVNGKLNVHLVAHSHDDVGWLKTVDQYYVGSNNSIQGACVENVLDSVVEALRRDPNRKFIFAEQAFFQRWWVTQEKEIQEEVRKLVDAGQLEFINGGWVMHDEAASHYVDMIDQTTLGHYAIKKQFNSIPRAGWQIDPFGHSAVQAYLLGAELGFDSVHFARIDYQDRAVRKDHKSLETLWRGSKTFGSSSQDNPHLYDYNVADRVNDFVHAAITQANVTQTNHIMWTMGDDFQYQDAETWFKQMDKLIHYVNKDGRVNALYSTPSIYTDAKHAANESWPLKSHDYFPYADGDHAYWTGYFTSRPSFKRYVRALSGYNLAARQLEFLSGRRTAGPNTYNLGEALGIAQHHDAITGTAKQHTTDDYMKRLAAGVSEAEAVTNSALDCLLDKKSKGLCNTSTFTFDQVDNANLVVQDSLGSVIESQYLDMDNVTINLRNLYTKAYLGKSSKKVPKFWLAFGVSLPPLGWNTYFITERKGKGRINRSSVTVVDRKKDQIVDIGPGNVKMSFSSSGQLLKMSNSESGVDVPLQQSFLYYTSMGGEDGQASGAYIFRPSGDPTVIHNKERMVVVRGVLVDEIHQQFDSWIYQVTRLYRDKDHAEVEFTIRNYREDWKLSVNEPVAGNYYPINLGIYANDSSYEFSVLVDRATGGASIKDGQIELMLHRRLLADDSRGVGEPLNEEVCVEDSCSGLTIRGHYYVNIHKLGAGAQWRRTTGQEVYSPLLLAFTHENLDSWKASRSTKATSMDSNYNLPLNVALITLQELEDKYVLLRLAHLYEAGEDAEYSGMAIVELRKIFSGKQIKEVKEMSLSANQEKSEMKRLKWRVEGEDTSNVGAREHIPLRGSPVDGSTLVVELGPMEIRTFLLKF